MELFKNFIYRLFTYIRFVLRFKPNVKKPSEVLNYPLTFCDFFQGEYLDKTKWMEGQPWGEFHPDSPHQYYGKGDEFIYVKDSSLNLVAKYKPKKFYDFKNNVQINILHGIGLVVSKQSFKYGYYEISGILPKGIYLWSAIWLTAVKTWPPEIDILEAYSGKKSNYSNSLNIPNVKFQHNIHYGFVQDKTKESYGAYDFPLPNDPTTRPATYAVHWTENFIKFYYDGYLIFETKKKEILDYFNKPDVTMSIILNNGFAPEITNYKNVNSVFKINYVKYFSKI